MGQIYSHVSDWRNFDPCVSQSNWDFSEQSIYPHCCCLVFKSYLTLCIYVCVWERERDWERYPMDCSLSGFSALQISQARILEQVVISFSRGSGAHSFPTQGSKPSLLHCGQVLYHLRHLGSLILVVCIF